MFKSREFLVVIYDDILVFGEGSEDEELVDHNQNLRSLMQSCGKQNIKLNKYKVKLLCEEVPFLGHLISKDGLKADPAKIIAVLETPTPITWASFNPVSVMYANPSGNSHLLM